MAILRGGGVFVTWPETLLPSAAFAEVDAEVDAAIPSRVSAWARVTC